MRKNSKQLIMQVRQNLFEFQTTVLSDEAILAKLNEAYNEVYQILIKSYPDIICKTESFSVISDKVLLPREVKSSRILDIYAENYIGVTKLEQVSYSDYIRGRLRNNSVYSFTNPLYYALNQGYMYLYPDTQCTLVVNYVPELTPLGPVIGQISEVKANTLPLYNITENIDRLPEEREVVTITDHETGFVKGTYQVTLDGDRLNLRNSKLDRYNGLEVSKVESYNFERILMDSGGRLTCIGSNNLEIGDSVSIEVLLEQDGEYYTSYGLDSDSPDYVHSYNWNIDRNYVVIGASRTGVSLATSPYNEVAVNTVLNKGYLTPIKEPNENWVNISVTDSGYGYTQVFAEFHNLGLPGDNIIVELAGADYVKAKVISETVLELNFEVTSQTQLRLKKLTTDAELQNSFPVLFSSGTERAPVSLISVTKGSLTKAEEIYSVFQNDLVTLGATSGTHKLDTHFEKYLVYYATALIKDSMQEDIRILAKILDQILKDVHSDIGYRRLNRRMRSETPRNNHCVNFRSKR